MNETENCAHNDEGSNATKGTEAPDVISPIESARRVFLAGLGAVAVATEATDQIFQQLVKRGEQTREEAMREIRQARSRSASRREDASSYFRHRMDSMLNMANLPSKGDVDAINAKLNILTRKVDDVQAGGVDSARETRPSEESGPT